MTTPLQLATVMGGSASDYDPEHVAALVSCISSVAHPYEGGQVCLHGMTWPFQDSAYAHAGYLEFQICKDGLAPIAFGVEFGSKEPQQRINFPQLSLAQLRMAASDGDTINDKATVANFDELWLFANQLVIRLSLREVTLAFGGIGNL